MLEDTPSANSSSILFKSCEELKSEFLALKTQRDIADLLEVSYDRLIYHAYKAPAVEKYKVFEVPKKNGGSRKISSPSTGLKAIQRKLSQVLYSTYKPNISVHGFVPTQSIVTNAEQHIHKRFVFNIDLQDFFGSVHFGRVRGIFMAPPYKLPKEVSTVLAQVCCFENRLPQGAPTSPVVSNMVCARLDSELKRLARKTKCTYTRYADDITFSTTLSQFPQDLAYVILSVKGDVFKTEKVEVGDRLASVIKDNGFVINDKKVRLQHRSHHQEVTGITVNQFPNVKRSFIREISLLLHVWDKYGSDSAQKEYSKAKIGKLNVDDDDTSFVEAVRGKINFLGMVRGKKDKIYLKYLNWYQRLAKTEQQ